MKVPFLQLHHSHVMRLMFPFLKNEKSSSNDNSNLPLKMIKILIYSLFFSFIILQLLNIPNLIFYFNHLSSSTTTTTNPPFFSSSFDILSWTASNLGHFLTIPHPVLFYLLWNIKEKNIFPFIWLNVECIDRHVEYYEIFGLTPETFDLKSLKKSYRELIKKYHPDKNKDAAAHDKFIKISTAYETLLDPEKRRIYDKFGIKGLQDSANAGGQQYTNPFDLFAQFAGASFGFGGHGRRGDGEGKSMSPPIFIDLPIGLKAAFTGSTLEIDVDKQVLCPLCHGSGAKSNSDVITCSTCSGAGVRVVQEVIMGAFVQYSQSVCSSCKGKGKTIKHTCDLCKGKRVGKNHREVSIKIEKGIRTGNQVKLDGAGDEHPDKETGPIIFNVIIEPDPIYERKGDNLYTTETITLLDALLGFSKTIRYLNGKSINLTRTNVTTQPGFVQVLKGYGMPRTITEEQKSKEQEEWWSHRSDEHDDDDVQYNDDPVNEESAKSKRGDLFVTYQVILPTHVSASDRKVISSLFGSKSYPAAASINIVNEAKTDESLFDHLDL